MCSHMTELISQRRVLTDYSIIITLTKHQVWLPDDGRKPKHVGAL